MSQQPYGRTPSSIRYSSRKPIFDSQGATIKGNENEELYRIVAKIRSLEDDVKTLIQENQQIQSDNIYLKKEIGELEYSGAYQEDQVVRLMENIARDPIEDDHIRKYEEELKMMAKKVDFLHEEIHRKHEKYDQLKIDRERLLLEDVKAKEAWNQFQFEQNGLIQKLDEVLMNFIDKKDMIRAGSEEKVVRIIEYCKKTEGQIARRNQEMNAFKKKAEREFTEEREKRIQEEYSLQLLRERNQDYEKKKDFFKSCYNEEKIERVIDDMLEKEHELRQEISFQLEKNDLFKEQSQDAFISCDKRISREKATLLEDMKFQRVQNDVAVSQRQRAHNDLSYVEESLSEVEEEGASITMENRVADGSNFKKISELQAQNVMLEREYAQVLESLSLLKQEMSR